MLVRRHSYFAYGSNLCAKQMSRRCPNATDPRPATLADHDWLINERGVATVAPFDGSQVHGVVWQSTTTTSPRWTAPKGSRCGTAATGSPCTPTRGRPRRGCTSTIASTPGRRGPVISSASSTAHTTTGCRTAGSTSCAAGIHRSGRYQGTTRAPMRRNPFPSCSPIPVCLRRAPFAPGSASWPSTAAGSSR